MALLLFLIAVAPPDCPEPLTIDKASRAVHFRATIYPDRFNALTSWPKNHHFIVWREGRAVRNALIVSEVPDLKIQRALESLGAEPGDNVPQAAWDRRADKDHPAPDTRVTGPLIQVTVHLPDGRSLEPEDVFEDKGEQGFTFRFGGHEALIPEWRSGCVVCLESCPGGRISNAAYTLRDYQTGKARFKLKPDLPKTGTEICVTLQLK
ncbi:MAG: YdjY domain-containing protein [Acidobacteriota bacterium]|nr:YdjY domain-containing protein [Acidobacteriota bacterium]